MYVQYSRIPRRSAPPSPPPLDPELCSHKHGLQYILWFQDTIVVPALYTVQCTYIHTAVTLYAKQTPVTNRTCMELLLDNPLSFLPSHHSPSFSPDILLSPSRLALVAGPTWFSSVVSDSDDDDDEPVMCSVYVCTI